MGMSRDILPPLKSSFTAFKCRIHRAVNTVRIWLKRFYVSIAIEMFTILITLLNFIPAQPILFLANYQHSDLHLNKLIFPDIFLYQTSITHSLLNCKISLLWPAFAFPFCLLNLVYRLYLTPMESTNVTPLSSPPAESHASFEELFEILQTHARNAGYAITTGNSEKRKGRVMKILVCKKSGSHRSEIDKPSRKRQRLTQKSLCPFRVKARERRDGRWDVCYLQNQDGSTNQESLLHNHEPFDPSAFPEHRRLNDDQMTILRTHNRMGIQPSRTIAPLKK